MQLTADPKKQILVVEDEGLIAADLQQRLQRLGYAVPAVVDSGEEALRCARSTPFDLALMDIHLGGEMDGIATARALKANFDTPIVYITAHADQETIQQAKLTEPFGYILKPIGDGDLRSAVEIAIYKHEVDVHLRTTETWLSHTLGSIGEGIIATNTAGKIVFMNPVAEQLTGWSAAEARLRRLTDVLGVYDESAAKPAINPMFDQTPDETCSYTLISKAGVKYSPRVDTLRIVRLMKYWTPSASPNHTEKESQKSN